MLFGRPENIIQNLLAKLRASPPVNINRLETLIHSSLEVKNIVATMQASNMVSHSNNPMLIQELIKRLPAQYRLDWALCAKRMPNLNLITFSDWLFYMAEAASSVSTIQCSTSNEEKRKPQRVNVHKERPSDGKKQTST